MSSFLSQIQALLGGSSSAAPQGIASLPQPIEDPNPPQAPQPPIAWGQFEPSTLPQKYIPTVDNPEAANALKMNMWAAGTVPKNTDPKTGLETMPINIDTSRAYAIARGMGATKHLGTAQLPPEQLAGMLLQEGRPDLGNNTGGRRAKDPTYYDKNIPAQGQMFGTLTSSGLDNQTASWLTRATAKQQLANRLNIPFGVAWNGTGTSIYGQSGGQYAKELQANIKAAQHPKNAEMLNLIRQGYQDGLTNPINMKTAETP